MFSGLFKIFDWDNQLEYLRVVWRLLFLFHLLWSRFRRDQNQSGVDTTRYTCYWFQRGVLDLGIWLCVLPVSDGCCFFLGSLFWTSFSPSSWSWCVRPGWPQTTIFLLYPSDQHFRRGWFRIGLILFLFLSCFFLSPLPLWVGRRAGVHVSCLSLWFIRRPNKHRPGHVFSFLLDKKPRGKDCLSCVFSVDWLLISFSFACLLSRKMSCFYSIFSIFALSWRPSDIVLLRFIKTCK